MCGIFALFNNTVTFSEKDIDKAFNLGSKRGPENSTLDRKNTKTIMGFHRLAINGLNDISNQPITIGTVKLICNGEIYNYKELFNLLNITPSTNSDCEIIIHLYKRYGIHHTLKLLDGVYSFILYDFREHESEPVTYIARDPFGVRPLYIMQPQQESKSISPPDSEMFITHDKLIGVASELKVLSQLSTSRNKYMNLGITNISSFQNGYDLSYNETTVPFIIKQFEPGTLMTLTHEFKTNSYWKQTANIHKFYIPSYSSQIIKEYDADLRRSAQENICKLLNDAVKKRVIGTSDRPIACLLSGGLDSSLITALVNKYYSKTLETYSIGMEGSEDLKRAKIVSQYLGTNHTEIILSKEQFFNAIPETIETIESYDTTTVRASVGNYLIGKYISENSDAKVIFNGDGSDELAGGYLYFLKCPDDLEFDKECRRLLSQIHFFDVLRSDKSISSNGLEPRTPFLDREFVDYYLSLPISIRNPMSQCSYVINNKNCEKFLLREAFSIFEPHLLPTEIIWRTKEAFSDGVSGDDGSWFEIIDQQLGKINFEPKIYTNHYKFTLHHTNLPITREQQYYREIFDEKYPNTANTIPYFWMPKYVDSIDSSARTLNFYNHINDDDKKTDNKITCEL